MSVSLCLLCLCRVSLFFWKIWDKQQQTAADFTASAETQTCKLITNMLHVLSLLPCCRSMSWEWRWGQTHSFRMELVYVSFKVAVWSFEKKVDLARIFEWYSSQVPPSSSLLCSPAFKAPPHRGARCAQSIQLNYNDECLMPITVYIPSNKQYSSHRSRRSYQVIIQVIVIITMLPLWSMSNVISPNQFKHFRVYWPQTNVITARSLERHFC